MSDWQTLKTGWFVTVMVAFMLGVGLVAAGLVVATGWRRLAIVLLVAWEIYWFIEWRSQRADAERLAREDYHAPTYPVANPEFDAAYAATDRALTILIASPIVGLVVFLAIKWIVRGFCRTATEG